MTQQQPRPSAYIGVDPGASGEVCLLVPSIPTILWCNCSEPPSYIRDWITYHQIAWDIKIIMIEDVHSLYGMSAKSNFTFGYNLGVITAICKTVGLGVDKVTPKVWQKAVGVKTKGGKNIKKEVAQLAETLYPSANVRGPKGGLMDGKSDSLMIAHHTFKTLTK
jgi:hypothetical protein